jgi:hypothetical protein
MVLKLAPAICINCWRRLALARPARAVPRRRARAAAPSSLFCQLSGHFGIFMAVGGRRTPLSVNVLMAAALGDEGVCRNDV